MVCWTTPHPNLDKEEVPKEVVDQGFYQAGLRCEELIRNDERFANSKVIIYTVLETSEQETGVLTLQKGNSQGKAKS